MITEQTVDAAEQRIQQLLNLLRDRKFGNKQWETIVMLKLNSVDEMINQLYSELEQ